MSNILWWVLFIMATACFSGIFKFEFSARRWYIFGPLAGFLFTALAAFVINAIPFVIVAVIAVLAINEIRKRKKA